MAGNTAPIYSKVGNIQWNTTPVLAANTTTDLTSGTIYQVFLADATNGGYVQKIRIKSLGTNVATVMRIWINNGSATGTAANNDLYDEIGIASTTASQTSALAVYEVPLNFALDPGYKIYVTIGTAVSAGFDVTVVGGKY